MEGHVILAFVVLFIPNLLDFIPLLVFDLGLAGETTRAGILFFSIQSSAWRAGKASIAFIFIFSLTYLCTQVSTIVTALEERLALNVTLALLLLCLVL